MAATAESICAYKAGIDLEDLVSNATWRELLFDLVESNKLDPWDIDIAKIVESYIAVVKEMRVLELHIPANIMLAASILLRMKSDSMGIFAEPEAEVEEPGMQQGRVIPEVPELVPRLRMQPRRKISLNELMDALNEAIKISSKREVVERERFEPLANIAIGKEDIDDKIEAALGLVKSDVDREGVTTFARIAKGFDSMEGRLLDLFVPLLFLANMKKVMLMQEEFFDEIFIRLDVGRDGGA
jgi:segregation and condensation protein A